MDIYTRTLVHVSFLVALQPWKRSQMADSPDSLRWLEHCLVTQEKHFLHLHLTAQVVNKILAATSPRCATGPAIELHRDLSCSPPLMLSSKTLRVPHDSILLLWTPVGAM